MPCCRWITNKTKKLSRVQPTKNMTTTVIFWGMFCSSKYPGPTLASFELMINLHVMNRVNLHKISIVCTSNMNLLPKMIHLLDQLSCFSANVLFKGLKDQASLTPKFCYNILNLHKISIICTSNMNSLTHISHLPKVS